MAGVVVAARAMWNDITGNEMFARLSDVPPLPARKGCVQRMAQSALNTVQTACALLKGAPPTLEQQDDSAKSTPHRSLVSGYADRSGLTGSLIRHPLSVERAARGGFREIKRSRPPLRNDRSSIQTSAIWTEDRTKGEPFAKIAPCRSRRQRTTDE